jgi:hypothetical protein
MRANCDNALANLHTLFLTIAHAKYSVSSLAVVCYGPQEWRLLPSLAGDCVATPSHSRKPSHLMALAKKNSAGAA